jgi:hypothetical protein
MNKPSPFVLVDRSTLGFVLFAAEQWTQDNPEDAMLPNVLSALKEGIKILKETQRNG